MRFFKQHKIANILSPTLSHPISCNYRKKILLTRGLSPDDGRGHFNSIATKLHEISAHQVRNLLSSRHCMRNVSAILAISFWCAASSQAQTWTGGGIDDNWSTQANWSGGVPLSQSTTRLLFPLNASRRAPVVDFYAPWILNRMELYGAYSFMGKSSFVPRRRARHQRRFVTNDRRPHLLRE
ncbi:MAG: hypothetical protein ABI539_00290 [Acidobacteriota bacterium]